MEPLSKDDVEQIAALARLELGDTELESLRTDLSAILGHMDALAAVATDGIEPMTQAVPMDLRLRDDEVAESLDPDRAVAAAADHQDGQFRVPHIIKSSGS